MKKMILLLLSGLLIVSMAGSALAGVQLVPQGEVNSDGEFIVLPNSVGYINITVDQMGTQDYTMFLNVSEPNDAFTAEIVGSDNGGILNTNAVASYGTPSIAKTLHLAYANTYKAKIKISRNDKTDLGIVRLVLNGIQYPVYVSADSKIVTAPEFPTIALPVAGVLGLLFVFGRKKEGL